MPKFAAEPAARSGELRNRDTSPAVSFGDMALAQGLQQLPDPKAIIPSWTGRSVTGSIVSCCVREGSHVRQVGPRSRAGVVRSETRRLAVLFRPVPRRHGP